MRQPVRGRRGGEGRRSHAAACEARGNCESPVRVRAGCAAQYHHVHVTVAAARRRPRRTREKRHSTRAGCMQSSPGGGEGWPGGEGTEHAKAILPSFRTVMCP